MSDEPTDAWARLPASARVALTAAWKCGVSGAATALYARWWQLENWLRTLVNVELRARDGIRWIDSLPPVAVDRAIRDGRRPYMPSPDGPSRLAYIDVSPLFELLAANWDLFGTALLGSETVWRGRAAELLTIRHRIGHVRRPDPDDLARLEQTLRDLDRAAYLTAAAINDQEVPDRTVDDPIVEAWLNAKHVDAHLIEHARRQHDVLFSLGFSRRPWAQSRSDNGPVSGRPGYLWHARWILRGTDLDLAEFWRDDTLDDFRDLIVLVCASGLSRIEVIFAAVDEPARIADAIGACFEAVLSHDPRYGDDEPPQWDTWLKQAADLDPRVQVRTPWAEAQPGCPFRVFEA